MDMAAHLSVLVILARGRQLADVGLSPLAVLALRSGLAAATGSMRSPRPHGVFCPLAYCDSSSGPGGNLSGN